MLIVCYIIRCDVLQEHSVIGCLELFYVCFCASKISTAVLFQTNEMSKMNHDPVMMMMMMMVHGSVDAFEH